MARNPRMISCNRASTAAWSTWPSCVARLHTSTSIVRVPGAPRTRITPNDVNVNRKMIAAAAATAGRISGRVISRKTTSGAAPSVAAASSMSAGRCSQTVPTARTVTARLNTTCAPSTAHTVRSRVSGRSARIAAPITTVGRTNKAVSRPRRIRRPAKSNRAITHAGTRPTMTVSNVDTTACQVVNQTIDQVRERPSTERMDSLSTASMTRVANGQA